MADEPTNNAPKPTNNAPKNNKKGNNKKGKNNKKEPPKTEVEKALSYNKNVPLMIMIGVFLFFVCYQLLMALRRKDEILKHKIEQEIRKKLYYTDSY